MAIALLIYFFEVNSIFKNDGYVIERTFKTMPACEAARLQFQKQLEPGAVYPIERLKNRWFYLSPACQKIKRINY